jgi:hypothetical protein
LIVDRNLRWRDALSLSRFPDVFRGFLQLSLMWRTKDFLWLNFCEQFGQVYVGGLIGVGAMQSDRGGSSSFHIS